jgi:uncharacterized membrane protein YjjP (DUF1212 family)
MTEQNHAQSKELILRRKLDLLVRTGCILMESLADTARILRNMKRAEAFLGLPEENVHIYVTYNMLMVNLSDEEHSFTKFQRVEKHGVNMTVISGVSKMLWTAIKEDYSLDRYEQELEAIHHAKRNYTPWQVAIGAGFACGGFCIQFGCDWPAFFYASIAAILGFRLKAYLAGRGMNFYMGIAVAAFVSTLLAWLSLFISINPAIADVVPAFMHSDTPYHPFMACALFIVPGVPLINFVNDMINGHVDIGMTRAVNILLMILAMSFGQAAAIYCTGIDNFVRDLSMTPHNNYLAFATAAAISAMGFSMIFNLPRRLLPVVAVGGIIAVCTRNFVNLGPSNNNIGLDQGLIIGSFAGSTLISIICTKAMHWFHTPHHCLSIPSVIPMIPGVLMYRALFGYIDMHGVVGELTFATTNMIKASLCIIFISVGVAIPNIFVRRLIEPKRKKKLLDMVVERRKRHGEMVDLSTID